MQEPYETASRSSLSSANFSSLRTRAELLPLEEEITVQQRPTSKDLAPCTTSPATEVRQTDARQELASILSHFGSAHIPLELFHRARNPCLVWGNDGEPEQVSIDVASVVHDERTFEDALAALLGLRVVRAADWAGKSYLIVDETLSRTDAARANQSGRFEAVRLLMIAFPTDRRLSPLNSYSVASSLLPLLQELLPSIDDMEMTGGLNWTHVVEVCLSASSYATMARKEAFVAVAENIASRHFTSAATSARITLRKMELSRMSSVSWRTQPNGIHYQREDKRSNAYYGEYVLFVSDTLLGSDGFAEALNELDKFQPLDSNHISTLEDSIMREADVLRGKILHFSGDFHGSKTLLERVIETKHQESSTPSRATAHLTAVCCELGDCNLGIRYATTHLEDIRNMQSWSSFNGRRLRLALATAWLMQGMWAVLSSTPTQELTQSANASLDQAQNLFDGLLSSSVDYSTRAAKINRVCLLLESAAIAHLKGALLVATELYESLLAASSECGWNDGYIEGIIHLSKSAALLSHGDLERAAESERKAAVYRLRPSFYFAGFGTLWPKIVGKWFELHGRGAVFQEIFLAKSSTTGIYLR